MADIEKDVVGELKKLADDAAAEARKKEQEFLQLASKELQTVLAKFNVRLQVAAPPEIILVRNSEEPKK